MLPCTALWLVRALKVRDAALCKNAADLETEPSSQALERLARYLKSSGRYGTSPFLVAQYGGLSEILQGFCR
jgi:RAB protein geranylgeranyltransferase component A